MPITLPPISRRRFLKDSLIASAGLLFAPRSGWSVPELGNDPNHLVLLSDIHISADPKALRGQTPINMWDQLKQASDNIIALQSKPAMVLVNGDCALQNGGADDYVTVVEALKPMRQAGLPIHLGLGNHDSREHLQAAVENDPQCVAELKDHRAMRLELPAADWYMLDTLNKTATTPGMLGEAQIQWLKLSLDARQANPAIVMLHHQPDERPPEKVSGLIDTKPFLEVVEPRKQVKVVMFGHTHTWKHWDRNGLHMVNLPTTAYVFDPTEPAGWVDAHLSESALKLQLHAITPNHPSDGQVVELKWR
jgi:Icc protein